MPHTIDELEQEIKLLQDEISYLHYSWTSDLKKYRKLQDEYDMMKLELQQLYSLIERCNIKIIK